jgi:hypothetical protein
MERDRVTASTNARASFDDRPQMGRTADLAVSRRLAAQLVVDASADDGGTVDSDMLGSIFGVFGRGCLWNARPPLRAPLPNR